MGHVLHQDQKAIHRPVGLWQALRRQSGVKYPAIFANQPRDGLIPFIQYLLRQHDGDGDGPKAHQGPSIFSQPDG
jgi:hypothetical protein